MALALKLSVYLGARRLVGRSLEGGKDESSTASDISSKDGDER